MNLHNMRGGIVDSKEMAGGWYCHHISSTLRMKGGGGVSQEMARGWYCYHISSTLQHGGGGGGGSDVVSKEMEGGVVLSPQFPHISTCGIMVLLLHLLVLSDIGGGGVYG